MSNKLNEAKEVLEEYSKANSMIDNGNLFFAAVEYQEAYEDLLKEKVVQEIDAQAHKNAVRRLKEANERIVEFDRIKAEHKIYIEKLQEEISALKKAKGE